jgi:hypothetical protein
MYFQPALCEYATMASWLLATQKRNCSEHASSSTLRPSPGSPLNRRPPPPIPRHPGRSCFVVSRESILLFVRDVGRELFRSP